VFGDVGSGGSSTAPWAPVAQSSELVLGERYRLRLSCMGPYRADTAARVRSALTSAAGLNNALVSQLGVLRSMVTIEDVRVSAPDTSNRLFAWPTFTIDVDYRKTGPGTPVVVVVGIIVALVVFALGFGFVVTKKEVFQRVKEAGGELRELISGSMVPLVLAVGLMLFLFRRA
jgi:nitrate reductase gamma subunit